MADVVLTKEEIKAARKQKFLKILKYVGIGLGIAAVSGGTAYLIGKSQGQKTILSTDGMQKLLSDARGEGVDNFVNEVADTLYHNGDFATKLVNNNTGEVKYINYTMSDETPAWYNESTTLSRTGYEIANQ